MVPGIRLPVTPPVELDEVALPDLDSVEGVDAMKEYVEALQKNERIQARKRQKAETKREAERQQSIIDAARKLSEQTRVSESAFSDASMWEARTGVARDLAKVVAAKELTTRQDNVELLRMRYRAALRDVAVLPGANEMCSICYDTALDAHLIGELGDDVSLSAREEAIRNFNSGPENRVIFQRTSMMTLCSKGHYICCVCAGDLLKKISVPASNNIRCPLVGCTGSVQTTGRLSLAGMAHTRAEELELARYTSWERPSQFATPDRPDLDHMWFVYDSLIYATSGTIRCPVCNSPVTMAEKCAHFTCEICTIDFCAWCGLRGRSERPGDTGLNGAPSRFGLADLSMGVIVTDHMKMCHCLLWAMHFIHHDFKGNNPNNWRHLVTRDALQRNFHGGRGFEHNMPVAGILQDNLDSVYRHYLDNPYVVAEDYRGNFVPVFPQPFANTDPTFSRMWGSTRYEDKSYVEGMYWRRDEFVEVQKEYYERDGVRIECEVCVKFGYNFNVFRLIAMSVVHFTSFCCMLEEWVYLNISLFKRKNNGIPKTRLQHVFAHARILRHHFEANVPWQVLVAMGLHQTREGFVAHYMADPAYKPFADRWTMSGHTSSPNLELCSYFSAENQADMGQRTLRLPHEGFPFVHPDEISVSDRAHAGVVYARLLEERDKRVWPNATHWEFSIEFHRRFHEEMDKYAATHPAGPMIPKHCFPRTYEEGSESD